MDLDVPLPDSGAGGASTSFFPMAFLGASSVEFFETATIRAIEQVVAEVVLEDTSRALWQRPRGAGWDILEIDRWSAGAESLDSFGDGFDDVRVGNEETRGEPVPSLCLSYLEGSHFSKSERTFSPEKTFTSTRSS